MAPNLEIQEKIIILIRNILTFYIDYEDACNSNPTLYYVHREFDSNVTEFEGLSNSNKIVLKTKLDIKLIPGIMHIFQQIYDNNYYMFEDGDWFTNVVYDEEEISEQMINDLMNYNNVGMWLQVLNKYNQDEINPDEKNSIGTNDIFDSIPSVYSEYYKSKKKQKVYTLESVRRLLYEL